MDLGEDAGRSLSLTSSSSPSERVGRLREQDGGVLKGRNDQRTREGVRVPGIAMGLF